MVSVILPVRNGEATIAEAVASVLAQTLTDLELIVIDDGSTDSTRKVLSTITDERVQVLSGPPSGLSFTRNKGIEHSRGHFLAFIDADDAWLPQKLEAQLAAFERMPEAAAAYCWTDYIDAHGEFVCPDSRADFEGFVYEQMLTHNFIDCGSNIVVRRQVLLDEGGFDESLPVIEDWDLSIRLSARHPFVCVPRALVRYRQLPDSLTTKVDLMKETFWRVIDKAFMQAPDSLQHLKPKAVAHFFEFMCGKSTQGVPTRDRGFTALHFFATAIRSRPANLLDVWQRPWVIKAVLKALLAIVLPSTAMQRLAERWPSRRRRSHV
jgi:glycosyltransferase involved in cell wall biosynthesis